MATRDPGADEGQAFSRDIERILSALKKHKISVKGAGFIEFVDREEEARAILEGIAGTRPQMSYDFIVLYGPKGCGKSALFTAISSAMGDVGSDETGFEAIVASYERWERAREAVKILGSRGVFKALGEVLKELGISIATGSEGIVLSGLEEAASKIVRAIRYSEKAREYGRIFIVLDEVRVARENFDSFVLWLESFANDVRSANLAYYERKRGYITVIALISDAIAAKAWYRVGEKVGWALMWNLSRDASERLADQLGIGEDRDLLWRLAGGNPRALERIRSVGLEAWVRWSLRRVVTALRVFSDRWQTLFKAIGAVAENPDSLGLWYGNRELPLADRLLRLNVVTEIVGPPGPIAELPKEPWVGGEFAFQIPAYYYALKAILGRGGFNISSSDLVAEAERS